MIEVTKRPLLIDGQLFDVGSTVPPELFNAQPANARHRWFGNDEVKSDFKDGEQHPSDMTLGQIRQSTIITNDKIVADLREVGCEPPNGVSERILFLVYNVVISGHPLDEAAARHHALAVLPDWVPDEFRATVHMSLTVPGETRLTGARQELLEGMLDPGVAHTTQENIRDNSERIPENEQLVKDPLHDEQMRTAGPLSPAVVKKKK